MDFLTIDGVKPYDGRYEFDLRGSSFTVREWGYIKRHSGYLPMTIDDGLAGADAELMAVFALIALVRADKVEPSDVPVVWERFADAPGVVSIRLELGRDEVDEDEDPPQSSTESATSSGDDSNGNSASSAEPTLPIGTRDSDTSGSLRVGGWES